jgi:hypothetical protein
MHPMILFTKPNIQAEKKIGPRRDRKKYTLQVEENSSQAERVQSSRTALSASPYSATG